MVSQNFCQEYLNVAIIQNTSLKSYSTQNLNMMIHDVPFYVVPYTFKKAQVLAHPVQQKTECLR